MISAKRVHFAHHRAFRDPADRGIARHLTDGLEILREEERSRAGAGGQRRGLRTGVARRRSR